MSDTKATDAPRQPKKRYATRYLDSYVQGKGETRVDGILDDLVAAARATQMSKLDLAEYLGLHINTLQDFGQQHWRPSLTTLRSMEKSLLPPDKSRLRDISPTPHATEPPNRYTNS